MSRLAGLSPRVRGNRRSPMPMPRAGETCARRLPDRGLSPRVRGNPLHRSSTVDGATGSIPARAGEPQRTAYSLAPKRRVYPRACGGTQLNPGQCVPVDAVYPRACGGTRYRRVRAMADASGLSPRVRGNRSRMRCCSLVLDSGSIPARAGEPLCTR